MYQTYDVRSHSAIPGGYDGFRTPLEATRYSNFVEADTIPAEKQPGFIGLSKTLDEGSKSVELSNTLDHEPRSKFARKTLGHFSQDRQPMSS